MSKDERPLTFLFTDIEGSTTRWETEPGLMRDLVANHDELMERTIEGHSGMLVKNTGDGVFAVFTSTLDAIRTAVESQRELARLGPEPLRVRMGIHRGTALRRESDYFGSDVNRAARLMGVAHGGQIVISDQAANSVADQSDTGFDLKDLGSHRLRDLTEPLEVFQVVATDIDEVFPPLASLDGYPNNLPAEVSSFIGRDEDIASVLELLDSHRLVSLTGAGGSGKTRLALQVAAEILPEFGDGAHFVDLAGLTEPELVPLAIASTLGLSERAGRAWIDVLADHVRHREMLLVLDNCEHLLDEAAETSSRLLASAAGLRILTTTREPLNVPGEVAWRVPTLDLPDGASSTTLDEILAFEAVRLFVERALMARPRLELTDGDVPHLVEICRRLDGLPLALELAAARVRVLSIPDIAAHLGDRFTLLSGGSRAALPRHRTLEGTVAWSYESLTPDEQELFRRLSVFSGGFGLSGAMVLGGPEALVGVAALVDKSLLSARTIKDETRYRMLETVAAFAHQRLREGFAEVRNAHLQWAAMFAGQAAQELDGQNQREWLDKVATELDNLRAAMQWSLDGGDPALGIIIAGSLYRYWYVRGVREGRRWLDLFLEADPVVDPVMRGRVLFAAGSLTQSMGENETASRLLKESLAVLEPIGEKRATAYAHHYLIRSEWGTVSSADLREMIDSTIQEFRDLEDPLGLSITLLFDAVWHMAYGSVDDIETLDELVTLAEKVGSPQILAHANEIPATAAWYAGDVDKVAPMLERAAENYLLIQNAQCAAHCLENTAGWTFKAGHPTEAATLLGAAEALREDTGTPTPEFESLIYDEIRGEVETELGDEFAAAWNRGSSMSMNEALEYVKQLAASAQA